MLLQSILLVVTGTGALVLRWGDVETIAQRETDKSGIVVLRFTKRHAVEIERAAADALIEEVITRQFDVEPMLEQVFADTKGEHGVGGFDLEVGACVAMRVHVEVGLQEPVVRQSDDVAQLQRQLRLIEVFVLTVKGGREPLFHERDIILWRPCDVARQVDTLLRAQRDDEPVAIIIVPDGGNVYLTVLLQALHHLQEGVDAMYVVGSGIETLPHHHRIQAVILDGAQIGITDLPVQAVLIDHVVVEQPVGRAVCALGITERELYFLDRSGQGDGWVQVIIGATLVSLPPAADEVVGYNVLIAQACLQMEAA